MNTLNITLLGAGFLMGLLGSPHCLGMCGGIVSAFGISMRHASNQKKIWLVAMYHIGRLLSYMILGVVAASVGATLLAPFMTHNSLPRVLLGGAVIFAALLMLGLPVLKNIEKVGLGLWNKLAPVRAKLFPLTTAPKALGAGLLWGFLPCGLVYGAIGVAVGMGATDGTQANANINIISGMLFMLAFGLGTLPMLLATQTVIDIIQKAIGKFSLRQTSGVLMLISGLLIAVPALTHNHHHAHHEGHHSEHSHTHHHDHHHHNDPKTHDHHQMTEHSHTHHHHHHHNDQPHNTPHHQH